ncbi:MAG TPA: competence/damage-inducible protein A [Gemmatimonadaceae bacterium]|nr:competence/damage-inducible protein A [Gemmatimonadaceae bacterium]
MTVPDIQSAAPPAFKRIEVVTIGDELLLGFTIDTNAAHLARALASIGMHIVRRTTVGDDANAIAAAVREALDRTGAVITTGGLGPTSDDLTKPAIAAIFGREMELDQVHVQWMTERWLKRFNRPLPAANRQQAMLPAGAVKLENNHGSAPGIWLEDDRGRWVAMLPGVPREMRGMVEDTLLPRLETRVGASTVVRSLTLRTTGVAESLLADKIDSMEGGPLSANLAYLPSIAGVDLRLTVRDVSWPQADEMLRRDAMRLRDRLGSAIYGENDDDLAAIVLDLCRARGLSIAVAESCTGGLLGARLTAIGGSSAVVLGGVIAYHNEVKMQMLGVESVSLAEYGAVSEEVVRQMAMGARRVTKATIGLAITGIAGPTGGTTEKPVGTVWIAADVNGDVSSRLLRMWGDREEIRQRSAQWTLAMLRERLIAHG